MCGYEICARMNVIYKKYLIIRIIQVYIEYRKGKHEGKCKQVISIGFFLKGPCVCLVKDKIYTRGQREETSYQVQDTYQNLTEQVAKTLKKNTIEQIRGIQRRQHMARRRCLNLIFSFQIIAIPYRRVSDFKQVIGSFQFLYIQDSLHA